MNGPPISLALLSSYSIQLFADALRSELQRWGWEVKIWQSEFNQYRQDIGNPESFLYRERPQAIILQLDGEDLFADWLRDPFRGDKKARIERSQEAAAEVDHWVGLIRARLPESLLVLNTIYLPPIHVFTGLEHHSHFGISDLATYYNAELGRIAGAHSNILINDIASLANYIGYRQWFDARLWHLARCRLSGEATNKLVQSTAALLRAWKGQTRKCLILDLDNTLWGGIVGEDGLERIVLGEEGLGLAYAEFQEEVAKLARKGILLAICSKNNEEDALDVLRRHPSMRLRLDAFAAWRINWRDKATNIRELAADLNIGLDSFVFIDDNPAERDLVRTSLPEVLVPEWPHDASEFKATLLELASQHFVRISVTAEDQARTDMYRVEGVRRSFMDSSGNLDNYYRSLQMRAEIGYADRFSIPRVAQLTQKTNQFNLTTRRYTEAEIRRLARTPEALVMWLSLRDRFSDDGVVGVLILKQCEARNWIIDTFLLSCRVMGRGVEIAFLGYACQVLAERGAEELIGEYLPTTKNAPTANVYPNLGFELLQQQAGTRWRLAVKEKPIPIPGWIAVEAAKEAAHA